MHAYTYDCTLYILLHACMPIYSIGFLYTDSTVKDYAKRQLLLHAMSLYIAPLPQDNWKILRDIKFPKTAKLIADTKLSCIELIYI